MSALDLVVDIAEAGLPDRAKGWICVFVLLVLGWLDPSLRDAVLTWYSHHVSDPFVHSFQHWAATVTPSGSPTPTAR